MLVFLGMGLAKAEKKNQADWRKPIRIYRVVTKWERLNLRKWC